MVENCAKAFLKRFQYRKRKEVYETSLDMVSGMLEKCDFFSKSVTKFYELHKKNFTPLYILHLCTFKTPTF
jgi:hypothetical protein